MSVPNQKTIFIVRSSENVRKDFLKVSNMNLESAMFNLKGNAFKLWCYFADNANGYQLDLYPVKFCSMADVSRSTYDRAFDELEEKGYLMKSKVMKNMYLFNEVSSIAKKPDVVKSVEEKDIDSIKKKYFDESSKSE